MSKRALAVVAGLAAVVLAVVAILLLRDTGSSDTVLGSTTTSPATTSSTATTSTTSTPVTPTPPGFVGVDGTRFVLDGATYRFVGANLWQGMNLGIEGDDGDRARLDVELDRLQDLGVTNLRVMASSEGPDTEPFRMVPALLVAPGEYNEAVFDGLDYLLAELAERDMRAVMVLGNFWYWSGGMAQYVSWNDGSEIPYPGDWSRFVTYSAGFYTCTDCQSWYRDHITAVVERVNSYTGLAYRDDPTVFSWELANEPQHYPSAWIDDTATFIKSLDPNHLVTVGTEGSAPGAMQAFVETHDGRDVDYATIHIWPQNWGWYSPARPEDYEKAESKALNYFDWHVAAAEELGIPLVLEEFGLARDDEPPGDIYDPASPTTYRDRFYRAMYEAVYASASSGGPVAGDNFWAWGGEARPPSAWTGDPPHETPGWYSVYDTDESTLTIIAAHAAEMAAPE